jgi:DNA-binding transcriptional LysR family regulator
MNLKQLRAFKEVMLTGTVSKAASNLYRTQPAVSAQLTSLEREIGMPFFERREGKLHPVPEAEYLLAQAIDILDRVDTLQENLARVRDLETGQINIVAMLGPSIFFLPQLISEFVENRNHVDISLSSHSSVQTRQLLSAQRYDVGLVDTLPDQNKGSSLINHERLDYQCLCAVPANHPLAQQALICAEDLDNQPLAMLTETHNIYKRMKQIFEEKELILNRRFETQYFIPQLTFVEQGLACAVIDPITVQGYLLHNKTAEKIVFLPFSPSVIFSISIITPSHRPLSTLANKFVTLLTKELKKFQ